MWTRHGASAGPGASGRRRRCSSASCARRRRRRRRSRTPRASSAPVPARRGRRRRPEARAARRRSPCRRPRAGSRRMPRRDSMARPERRRGGVRESELATRPVDSTEAVKSAGQYERPISRGKPCPHRPRNSRPQRRDDPPVGPTAAHRREPANTMWRTTDSPGAASTRRRALPGHEAIDPPLRPGPPRPRRHRRREGLRPIVRPAAMVGPLQGRHPRLRGRLGESLLRMGPEPFARLDAESGKVRFFIPR